MGAFLSLSRRRLTRQEQQRQTDHDYRRQWELNGMVEERASDQETRSKEGERKTSRGPPRTEQ